MTLPLQTSPVLLVSLLVATVIAGHAEAKFPRLRRKPRAKTLLIGHNLRVVGLGSLPTAQVTSVIGIPPRPLRRPWLVEAAKRLRVHYREAGYQQVRSWILRPTSAAEEGAKDGVEWELQLDEGRMDSITFVGADTLRTLIFRVELFLPNNIFHRETLSESLSRIRKKYNLRSASYRVYPLRPPVAGPDGRPMLRRELRIYLLTQESFGWGVGLSLSSTYGLVPRLSLAKGGLLLKQDRLAARLGVALPYRQYLFSESPQFTWVHGFAALDYRLSRLRARFTPRLAGRAELSRLRRSDLGLDRFLLTRADLLAFFDALVTRAVAFELGLGYGFVDAWDQVVAAQTTASFPREYRHALVSALRARWRLPSQSLRRDLQSELNAGVRLDYSGADNWLVRASARAQYVATWGYHELILLARGETLHGHIGYWNQLQLSDFVRVAFDNRYWIERVATATVAFRLAIAGERLKLGVFHDLGLFGDGASTGAVANAFGPSLHLTFLDAFAFDAHYGFGFSPSGFDHGMVFSLKKVF